ncbi:ferric uptake regulator [Eubacteriaceae bacterium CHKCI004]|nr:ferric uptake regulator [Eubacteriaceae bacterium CHKCI004]
MRDKKLSSDDCYQRTQMQKEIIIERLRENGCRITKQRKMLLDIILKEDCSCCKEIYYKALEEDSGIGSATVYRMINTLEEIGAISRRNMYRVSCDNPYGAGNVCTVELDDNKICQLSDEKWRNVVEKGLRACGYIDDQKIKNIFVRSCEKQESL